MKANLVLLKKNGSHKAFALAGGATVLGRRDDCDLRIPLPTVSRRHCEVSLNARAVELRDLDSRGGTFVNGRRVDGLTPLKAGDYIRIGPLIFVCQIDGKPEKIVPPKKAAAKPKPPKPAPKPAAQALDDSDGKPEKVVPPKKATPPAAPAKPKPQPPKVAARAAPDASDSGLDADLSDLDVSDSFLNLDESDSDLEDLKNI
jgi:hypothetical protein